MKKEKKEYVLWLPSWYPNEYEPYNGDFIQRHAQATSLYCPITVVHFAQLGESTQVKFHSSVNEQEHLKEIILYPSFRPTGVKLADKLRYNYQYYRFAQTYLHNHFKENGLPRLVHVHVPMKSGNLARWIKRKYGIDYIVSEQASTYLPAAGDNYFQRHFLYKLQVRKIFQSALAVTNVSATIGKVLKSLFGLKEVSTIHNVVNTRYFNYAGTKEPVFTFIHVSTLSEQKNIKGILKVFARLKQNRQDWQLKLVGPYTHELKEYIQTLGLEKEVLLMGETPYQKVARHMKQAHAFVLFSRHENFPCVVVEALCCGLPVVAPDLAGIGEAVNASNGLLVPTGDEQGLFQALIELMENYSRYDPEAIAREAGRLYSYQSIGQQFFNLYSFWRKG